MCIRILSADWPPAGVMALPRSRVCVVSVPAEHLPGTGPTGWPSVLAGLVERPGWERLFDTCFLSRRNTRFQGPVGPEPVLRIWVTVGMLEMAPAAVDGEGCWCFSMVSVFISLLKYLGLNGFQLFIPLPFSHTGNWISFTCRFLFFLARLTNSFRRETEATEHQASLLPHRV